MLIKMCGYAVKLTVCKIRILPIEDRPRRRVARKLDKEARRWVWQYGGSVKVRRVKLARRWLLERGGSGSLELCKLWVESAFLDYGKGEIA